MPTTFSGRLRRQDLHNRSLTRAESRLITACVRLLDKGVLPTYSALAKSQGVSVETIRRHLSSVYAKTGTSTMLHMLWKMATPAPPTIEEVEAKHRRELRDLKETLRLATLRIKLLIGEIEP